MCERQCEGFGYSTFDLGAKPPLTPCGNIFEHVTRRISVRRRCANTRQQVRSLKKSTSIMLKVCYCLEHRSRQAVVLRAVRQRDFVKMLTQSNLFEKTLLDQIFGRGYISHQIAIQLPYSNMANTQSVEHTTRDPRALSTLHGTPER